MTYRVRSGVGLLLGGVVSLLAASQAHAFFGIAGLGGPIIEKTAPKTLEVDRLLPFFSTSRANLVVRVNPNSETMADPAVRDAVLALVMLGTRGSPVFPLEIQGTSRNLVWAEPGLTMSAYDVALEEFGGMDEDVVALAERFGITGGPRLGLHEAVGVGLAADRRALRPALRDYDQRLREAGYGRDDAGALVDPKGETVKIYIRPSGGVSPSQIGALEAIRSHAGLLGVEVVFQKPEQLSPDTLITTDALISVERSDRGTSLETWIGAFELIDELDAFVEALPSDLSARQQVSSLALIDQYLVDRGYVVPIAVLPDETDVSTPEARQAAWKPMLAEAYLKSVCGANWRLQGYGRTPAGFMHIDFAHPLTILLPEDGGPTETFAIYASREQVGVENRGVLIFNRPRDPGVEASGGSSRATVEVAVRRLPGSDLLVMEDAAPYLRLAEEYAAGDSFRSQMQYRDLDGPAPDERMLIDTDAKGIIEAGAVRFHDFSAHVVKCARTLAESDAPVEFGPVSSLD